jgi:hypothetical protein
MGRNSVEATNACRMRAVRAVLAALLARALLLLLLPGFVLFFFAVAVCPLGFADEVDEVDEVWPATGATAISVASAPASHRGDLDARVVEFATFISPL